MEWIYTFTLTSLVFFLNKTMACVTRITTRNASTILCYTILYGERGDDILFNKRFQKILEHSRKCVARKSTILAGKMIKAAFSRENSATTRLNDMFVFLFHPFIDPLFASIISQKVCLFCLVLFFCRRKGDTVVTHC